MVFPAYEIDKVKTCDNILRFNLLRLVTKLPILKSVNMHSVRQVWWASLNVKQCLIQC